ncbi:MAG: hypothetical protein A3C12_00680 [Candidatus Sungbacteria bacterium RIFCSPHIGHO2_02_FULL_49_20]|uniref:Uncharacterized protein n=1 Tax=Candidatus Sungbacteria bacterium RIFCSPHIGHO2_02_FULL_49_20 TaxID=1802272 RepID=A0A1G2KNT9_9BACT|nr:MAG: hypothetical protein A3C12_00680 [Candidatus Sungbacteria bacterium RIFCSPHIGHO2_02_FULL_49_20]
MKRWEIIVAICSILLFGFLFSRDLLARFAWQKYHSPATALVFASQDTKLLMQLGNYYFNGGAYDLARAKRAYEKALRVDPKILWGHYQLGRIYFVEGKFDLALEEINKELEANPENLRSLYVRGLIYGYRGQAGDLAKAEEDFQKFTTWAPMEWAGYNDLSWILSKEGKYREAGEAAQRGIEISSGGSENPWLWNSLGVAFLNLGKISEAKAAFERAFQYAGKLDPAEWRSAYPGNNPFSLESGYNEFLNAIRQNISKTERVDNSL